MLQTNFLQWDKLLSPIRARASHNTPDNADKVIDLRKDFEKDFQRVILSASFRRLQDKTQVFPLDKSDFVRTRLTHSLETASFAKSICKLCFTKLNADWSNANLPDGLSLPKPEYLAYWENILLTAGLLHDIGNPPFGHYGETTIRAWFKNNLPRLNFHEKSLSEWLTPKMQADLLNFEGNAQALRLLTKLHFIVDEHGMNLSYPVLHCLIKYPVHSLAISEQALDVGRANNSVNNLELQDVAHHKLGYFYAEREIFRDISLSLGTALGGNLEPTTNQANAQLSYNYPETRGEIACRHPLSFLLEACDDIAYRTADIEDALRKGKLSYHTLLHELNQAVAKQAELKVDLDNLLYFYNLAETKHYVEPELYAVQNWLIQAQSRLLTDVAASFSENYVAIMQGQFRYPLAYKRYSASLLDLLGDIAYRYVFTSKDIVSLEVACDTVLRGLLDLFIPACIYFEKSSVNKQPVHERLMRLVSKNYMQSYHLQAAHKDEKEQLYLRLLLITDYICGMTDNYARDLYQQLKGISEV